MKRLTCFVLLSAAFSVLASAEVIKSGSFQASSDGINVTLHWYTEDETNVVRFEVERRSGTEGEFTSIGTVDPKGSSLYEYVDNSAFRKIVSLYQYRIKIVSSNGAPVTYSTIVTVNHTVSGVRRTWGSIKAMFR